MAAKAAPIAGLAATLGEVDQLNRSRALFAVALGGVLLYVVLDAAVQSLPPFYDPIIQPESDLAVGPYGYLMTLNFVNRGILSLSFLFALFLAANVDDVPGPRFRMGGYLFGVWSLGALFLAALPTDVPPNPVSLHGALHFVVAVFAFIGGAFGALYLSRGMATVRTLSRARKVALPLAYIAVALLVVELFGSILFPGLNANYGGVLERAYLGSILLWIGLVSSVMIANSSPKPLRTAPKGPR